MADETATLHDTVVSPEPETTGTQTDSTTSSTAESTTAPDLTQDRDAAEIGRLILDSGISKDGINQLLEAPRALDALRDSLQNNPQEFLNSLFRTDPKIGAKFLETAADVYVQRYGSDDSKAATGKAKADSQANDGLMREVEALREQVTSLRTAEERRNQAAAMASISQRYQARVDDLLNVKEVKELNLNKSELKAIRARIDRELSTDQGAVERASKGNFVDVPRVFKGIIEEWANDRKEAINAATAQKERAAKGAFADFSNGPNFLNFELPKGTSDSWDATETGFADAIKQLSR